MYDELVNWLREIHPEKFGDAWDFAFACQQAMHEAADAIEELQAQLMYSNDAAKAIAEKVPKWIPVTERLPNHEGRYITAFSKGEVGENVFLSFRGAPAKWYYNSEDTGEVTHWMSLPEPPKGENHDN